MYTYMRSFVIWIGFVMTITRPLVLRICGVQDSAFMYQIVNSEVQSYRPIDSMAICAAMQDKLDMVSQTIYQRIFQMLR